MSNTKVLLVGSGAREHALADALIAGGAELYAYMQLLNPGIKKIAAKYAVGKADDVSAAAKFAKENSVEIAVIGPEAPLAAGMVDELEATGIKCVGPARQLAQLETSKSFARQLLKKYGIEGNPEFKIFTTENAAEIPPWLEKLREYAVKPDGLTSGKGVKVSGEHLGSNDEALDYCNEILNSHNAVVVEEKLEGEEFSLQSLTDGNSGFLHFPCVQDHKRAFDGDKGGNTGGMGSYSDANFLLPFLTQEDVEAARKITEKVAVAIKKELGEAYKGVMYGGFMKTANGIKLIEYNARFGDPEAMNVIPLLKTNFVEVCKATVEGRLASLKAEFERKATVCKYVVPEGYPDNPKTGRIEVPSVEKDYIKSLVYYAAVEEKGNGIYTTKSRGVAFVGVADTIAAAEKIAEESASMVKGTVYHRKDIGTPELVQKRVEHIRQLTEKNVKGVIFDMDGVIIDSEPFQLQSFNAVLKRHNISVNMGEFKQRYIGLRDSQICEKIIQDYKLPLAPNEFLKGKRSFYLTLLRDSNIQAIAGAVQAIDAIKKQGLPLAIASSSCDEEIDAAITKFGLKNYFSAIVSAHTVKNGKPAPDVYIKAAEKLGVHPESCIAIEDTATGVKSAKAAGMTCIAVTTTHLAEELTAADKVARNHSELPEIIASMKEILKPLYNQQNGLMKIAAFMSGTGSNLRKILELQKKESSMFKVVMIFSDTADENLCNARKIAEEYKIAYYCNDIHEYYAKRGQSNRKDLKIRQDYDAETAKLLKMHKADVVALCGYMSLLTKPVIGQFLTINVHPADLRTKDENGHRTYAGCMGSDCVKAAIMKGEREVRSTTHIVTDELDAGGILLVSKPVKLEGVENNELEDASHYYQEKLKEQGDWKIYPETIKLLAEGRFAMDGKGAIFLDGKPIPEGKEMN